MSQTEAENSTDFLKRRFSLTKEANDLIDELAETRHGGNRSAAIRAAVFAQAQRRDEDELRHGLKRLQKDVQALTEQVKKLQETDELDKQSTDGEQSGNSGPSADPSQTGSRSNTGSGSVSDARVAREIYTVMRTQNQDVYALGDLVASVDFSLSQMAVGIDVLVEQGAIDQLSSDDETKFRLIDS